MEHQEIRLEHKKTKIAIGGATVILISKGSITKRTQINSLFF